MLIRCRGDCGSLFSLFLYFLSQVDKRLLNILACFSASLKETHAELLSECRSLFSFYHLLVNHVSFVAYKDLLDVHPSVCVRLELTDPVTHAVEGLLAGAVVCEDHTVGLVEVLHGHGAEALLARGVPHQKLDVLPVNLHILYLEVNPYRGDVLWGVLIIREFLEEAALSHLGVSQGDELNLHIELLGFALGTSRIGTVTTRRRRILVIAAFHCYFIRFIIIKDIFCFLLL